MLLMHRNRAKIFDSTFHLPHLEWSVYNKTGKPVRGSAEKSEYFVLFLMSATFCWEGGIVLDLLVGTGTLVQDARKASVHICSMDSDIECVSWLKENRGLEPVEAVRSLEVEESPILLEFGSMAFEPGSPGA
ncbi:hypothetical protein O6H91_01G127400 [Diphasiastrum complanatum]|uniref:Uncharacterized protein n=1 Tax=Diphasiastrum complanatum TaxID=34168 RepID=A0ACC2EVW1_DIPCM|nr:hypothetical protein O6H91_01G127400 [Diphasiastrum complanatum]